MPVPNTFANATSAIPLSQLDNNFATAITLGNTAIQLGNTVTTLNNMTLANVTISSVSAPISASVGGTGATSLTANNVLIGNGTGSVTFVAPGTSGNVLTSNGTAWLSQSLPTASTVTQQIFTFTALTGTFARGASKAGTYSQSGTTVTVTFNSHGFIAGDRVYLDFTSGTATDSWFTIATATTNTFTVTRSSATTSGNVTIYPPVVVTVNNHGQTTGAVVYVDYSATFTDAAETIYQATTNTFQTQGGATTGGTSSSGNVTLSQIGTSQTWTKPTGCKKIMVQLVGGGGGAAAAGGQGGGGGYAQELIDVTSVSSVSVTIGGPGLSYSGSTQTSGGTTSFGAYLSATGGNVSAVGVGSGGDVNLRGGYPFTFISTNYGGGSYFGDGGYDGANALGYGAGGSASGGCAPAYGNGTSGVVFVMEYY